MLPILLIVFLAAFFYLFLPGIGAFYSRRQWRKFRRNIVESTLTPLVKYEHIHQEKKGFLGTYRFLGSLEAIQEDTIWLRGGGLSISADLKNGQVYVLPSYAQEEKLEGIEENRETLPDEMPKKIVWNRIFSLPEGTKIFIGGALFNEAGRSIFRGEKNHPLTVVIYDGGEETFLRRSIWNGRQRNEYWNRLTPSSLAAGSFSLIMLGYHFLKNPYLYVPALLSLSSSIIPVMVFAPPGILLFFLYRNLWRKGRFLRAERDLLQLPLRFFDDFEGVEKQETTSLPDGSGYGMHRLTLPEYEQQLTSNSVFHKISVRASSYLQGNTLRENPLFLFGAVSEDNEIGFPDKAEDPMVEFLLVPGNPADLSRECAKKARMLEIEAVVAFTVGLIGNFMLIFLIFRILIR